MLLKTEIHERCISLAHWNYSAGDEFTDRQTDGHCCDVHRLLNVSFDGALYTVSIKLYLTHTNII